VLLAGLLLAVAGCASGDDTPSADSSTTATGSPTSSAGETSGEPTPTQKTVQITVSVQDGKVTPKPRRVAIPLGDQIRLQVTSDVDDELHVHGFDVEEPLEAGRTTTVELTADQQGVFEVETHETELELLQLEVR
jgi:heme/copper-type cytochrome/quinol oxidase subunit 2